MTPKYVRGGIGDILLSLESAIAEKIVDVYSHYEQAPDLFAPFGVKVNRFEYFTSVEDLNKIFIPGEELERKAYPNFTIPESTLIPHEKVLGIHVEGSSFSNEAWSKRGQPTKNMSRLFLKKLLEQLCEDRYNGVFVYIFCAPSRAEEIEELMHMYANHPYLIVAYPYIWDSLSCVGHCDAIIGADSVIKTMGAIQRIPSVVLVGDYPDPFRDKVFLDPYVNDGHMHVIKYKNVDDVSPDEVLKFLPL
jgi:ADP-heptose:LPS heptosyltransferase